ncbi:SirB2 family protein [Modicisalibacter luteus]
MDYFLIKHIHMTAAGLSLALFSLRAWWSVRESPQLQRRWVKVLPHLIDTILLAAGITLMIMLRAWPTQHPWLAAAGRPGGLHRHWYTGDQAWKDTHDPRRGIPRRHRHLCVHRRGGAVASPLVVVDASLNRRVWHSTKVPFSGMSSLLG